MCFFCDCVRDGICELQAFNREYHVDKLPMDIDGYRYKVDDSLHTIVRDANKCVKCRHCVDICSTGALHMEESKHNVIHPNDAIRMNADRTYAFAEVTKPVVFNYKKHWRFFESTANTSP